MAVFSRYSKVIEADGEPMRVRTALVLINEARDELLAAQEADFDSNTRWCVAWFEQYGMDEGPFGVAETLSKAKNTSIDGLVHAGVLRSAAGKVSLIERGALAGEWDPSRDVRLTVWEVTQHLIRRLEHGGEQSAADLLRQVGGLAEPARELAYRLFQICDGKKWSTEALGYNALAAAWLEITRLATAAPVSTSDAPVQEGLGI
jgi:putative DNA methylase